jgi:hypothetical protein
MGGVFIWLLVDDVRTFFEQNPDDFINLIRYFYSSAGRQKMISLSEAFAIVSKGLDYSLIIFNSFSFFLHSFFNFLYFFCQ